MGTHTVHDQLNNPDRPVTPPMSVRPADTLPPSWHWGVAALSIAILVFVTYWNTLDNHFVSFDDRKYIYENPLLGDEGGLGAIWTNLWHQQAKLHYYPLTYTTFWLERQAVGPAPETSSPHRGGRAAHPLYHIDQIIIHILNAVMVMLVLKGLGVGFWLSVLSAIFFALHPINAISIAWMSERKNLLYGFFYWWSLLMYVSYRHQEPPHQPLPMHRFKLIDSLLRNWRYLLSILLFTLSLLSKSAAVTLAPLLIVTDRVLDQRWSRASVIRSIPYGLLALGVSGLTIAQETVIARNWTPVPIPFRPVIALSSLVHYVQKIVLPIDQALIYPRWEEALTTPQYWLSLSLALMTIAMLWRFRKWFPSQFWWGLGVFLLTISPVLGLKYFIWMNYSYVSDHYMYTGSVGVILMIMIVVHRLPIWQRVSKTRQNILGKPHTIKWRVALVTLTLCFFGWRSSQQADTWQNNATLWTHNIEVSPNTFVAHFNLGNHYQRQGDWRSALHHYQRSTEIDSTYFAAYLSVAHSARALGQAEVALTAYQAAIQTAARKPKAAHGIHSEYASYLTQLGRYPEALAAYKMLLVKVPAHAAQFQKIVQQLESHIATSQMTSTAQHE